MFQLHARTSAYSNQLTARETYMTKLIAAAS